MLAGFPGTTNPSPALLVALTASEIPPRILGVAANRLLCDSSAVTSEEIVVLTVLLAGLIDSTLEGKAHSYLILPL